MIYYNQKEGRIKKEDKDMMTYIIVGDTVNNKNCLVYAYGTNKEQAEETLNRMLNNPNETDKYLMKKHFNLRIEATEKNNTWW